MLVIALILCGPGKGDAKLRTWDSKRGIAMQACACAMPLQGSYVRSIEKEGGCSSYPIPASSVPLFGVCSTSTPDEQGHPLTEQAWPTRTRRQPLDGAAQGLRHAVAIPSPVQVGRGICLKRHQFQSVDTKFETAAALAGRCVCLCVVRLTQCRGSGRDKKTGGVAGSLIEARLQPWSLCFPRSHSGRLVRLGGVEFVTTLHPALGVVMGLLRSLQERSFWKVRFPIISLRMAAAAPLRASRFKSSSKSAIGKWACLFPP